MGAFVHLWHFYIYFLIIAKREPHSDLRSGDMEPTSDGICCTKLMFRRRYQILESINLCAYKIYKVQWYGIWQSKQKEIAKSHIMKSIWCVNFMCSHHKTAQITDTVFDDKVTLSKDCLLNTIRQPSAEK